MLGGCPIDSSVGWVSVRGKVCVFTGKFQYGPGRLLCCHVRVPVNSCMWCATLFVSMESDVFVLLFLWEFLGSLGYFVRVFVHVVYSSWAVFFFSRGALPSQSGNLRGGP